MYSNKLTLGLVGAIGLIVGLAFLVQWQINAGLRRDLAALHEKLGPGEPSNGASRTPSLVATGAPATAGTLGTAERVELGRLRRELNELKTRTQALARVAATNAGGVAPLQLTPSGAWKNAGRNTPSEAAETLLWATDSGDVQELAKSITLDAAAREKAETMLLQMSPELKKTYDTPEKLVALLLAREVDIRAMQVIGESTAGDDALVNLRLQKDDGKTKEEGMTFQRTPEGWRMRVTGKAVDKMGKKLNDPPKK
ncbi:nuclear transport factor 2 family protein [Horticoccus sp. 23ND18S-11]|uniref:hypothetical protein n=1 Tax=Horticoccus sp. 23ND18S-11 TaxID=3391832 RepID=UPI0039C9C6A5